MHCIVARGLLLLCLLGGCGGGGSGGSSDQPAPSNATVTATIGNGVPAATISKVVSRVSALSSVAGASGGSLVVPATGDRRLVFAIDAMGLPLLASNVGSNSATLDARSTAVVMSWIALGFTTMAGRSAATVEAAIQATDLFAALEQKVTASLLAGDSPLKSTEAIALAHEVADAASSRMASAGVRTKSTTTRELARAAGGTSDAGVTNVAPPLPYYFIAPPSLFGTLSLSDANGGVNLLNETRLKWVATSRTATDELIAEEIIEWLPFDAWSPLWLSPGAAPTITALRGNATRFTVRLEQTDATRQRHLEAVLEGLTALIVEHVLPLVDSGNRPVECGREIAAALFNDQLREVLEQPDGEAVRRHVHTVVLGLSNDPIALGKLVNSIEEKCYGGPVGALPTVVFLRAVLQAWAELTLSVEASKQLVFLAQVLKYWRASFTTLVCKRNGSIEECVDRVEFEAPAASVERGQSTILGARVIGKRGTNLTTLYPIKWSVSPGGILDTQALGSAGGVNELGVVGVTSGSAVVSATEPISGATATSTVSVGAVPPLLPLWKQFTLSASMSSSWRNPQGRCIGDPFHRMTASVSGSFGLNTSHDSDTCETTSSTGSAVDGYVYEVNGVGHPGSCEPWSIGNSWGVGADGKGAGFPVNALCPHVFLGAEITYSMSLRIDTAARIKGIFQQIAGPTCVSLNGSVATIRLPGAETYDIDLAASAQVNRYQEHFAFDTLGQRTLYVYYWMPVGELSLVLGSDQFHNPRWWLSYRFPFMSGNWTSRACDGVLDPSVLQWDSR